MMRPPQRCGGLLARVRLTCKERSSNMKQHILISGAGVTGLSLGYWLNRFGFVVTLVESSPGFRRGGHAIDVRGVALKVLKAMGLFEKASSLRTRSKGM